MNTVKFVLLSVIIAISGASDVWNGPFADNALGQQVGETPEVAAARKYHEQFYANVRAHLPELSPEKSDVDNHYVPQPQQEFFHHTPQQHFPPPQIITPPPPAFPFEETRPKWTGPIADHVLGQVVHETPEVAAARRHHEEVFAKVDAVLPDLPIEEDHSQIPQYVPQVQPQTLPQVQHEAGPDFDALSRANLNILLSKYNAVQPTATNRPFVPVPAARTVAPVVNWASNGAPAETPEVAAARAEHARAFAASWGR